MAHDQRLICNIEQLREGAQAVVFACERDGEVESCFAVRFKGEIHAYINRCPHRGTPLDWQPGEVFDESGLYFICATHGALFEPDTGLCIAGPCNGMRLAKVATTIQDHQVLLKAGRVSFIHVPDPT